MTELVTATLKLTRLNMAAPKLLKVARASLYCHTHDGCKGCELYDSSKPLGFKCPAGALAKEAIAEAEGGARPIVADSAPEDDPECERYEEERDADH
jgi:hypothetical protein